MATEQITICGRPFNVPIPAWLDVGQPITENIHASVAQTFCENVRNNQAAKWAKEFGLEKGTPLPEDKVAEAQAKVDAYAATYVFGVRSGGGRGPSLDPIGREAMKLARDKVRVQLRAKGLKATTEAINDAARRHLEGPKGEATMRLARQIVRGQEEAAKEALAEAA